MPGAQTGTVTQTPTPSLHVRLHPRAQPSLRPQPAGRPVLSDDFCVKMRKTVCGRARNLSFASGSSAGPGEPSACASVGLLPPAKREVGRRLLPKLA